MTSGDDKPQAQIETLVLANHAEAVNGLLYIAGGCWTIHWRQTPSEGQPPPISHFGIALAVLIPWTQTNRRHHLTLRIEPEDGGEPLVSVDGDLEVGRPPGVSPGSDQRAVLAVNADVQFPKAGGYRVLAELSSGHTRSVSFQVRDVGSPPAA